ncbi:hypothetical protein L2E82_01418 [Cichorium intybus]|uniref:Uncharacterized protein n=2 Tax=Cichorium intybus TaxID=13427 RepID=A0ACB9GZI5_CICIN|nr:hypothetical protein L2E82_01417 [Cichorium intybus]KAI3788646.1 hypothetical protein L2E82_01418 [Cichorium intybus]
MVVIVSGGEGYTERETQKGRKSCGGGGALVVMQCDVVSEGSGCGALLRSLRGGGSVASKRRRWSSGVSLEQWEWAGGSFGLLEKDISVNGGELEWRRE